MKTKIIAYIALCVMASSLSSCLGDGDDDTVYYDDAAITSFTLGTLNCTNHTTSSTGEDSTYTSTLAGSSYVFHIDQETRTIENTDSLPMTVDLEHVVCTISAKNGGSVAIKNIDSDTLQWYSSTDSIDFSVPRTFYVYSSNGTTQRQYTVKVNAHQQDSTAVVWSRVTTLGTLRSATCVKALALGSNVYVISLASGTATVSRCSGGTWQTQSASGVAALSEEGISGMVASGDHLYTIAAGQVLRSTDGTTWETRSTDGNLTRMVAATDNHLWAYGSQGIMASDDGGATWTAEQLDDQPSLLPQLSTSYVVLPSQVNADVQNILLMGYASTSGSLTTWQKVDHSDSLSGGEAWMLLPTPETVVYRLPYLADVQMALMHRTIYAMGGQSPTKFYRSEDSALSWRVDDNLTMPSGANLGARVAMTIDESNYFWLFSTATGEVWRGRVNYMGW